MVTETDQEAEVVHDEMVTERAAERVAERVGTDEDKRVVRRKVVPLAALSLLSEVAMVEAEVLLHLLRWPGCLALTFRASQYMSVYSCIGRERMVSGGLKT